ncbi:prepilin-type N-terminal cleavage/methylation domain-containing protein [Candidatus Saccharibacteria bacterium]|nr:prepilin-type N-terminal cleavage/methylation domain-containing protein [Candidatus Saccharibacteria bacterium]
MGIHTYKKSNIVKSTGGFTIVELMIATSVFSFVLLVASTGVVAIGRLYYKGITSSKTQEAARSIIEDVSRARQFTGGNFSSGGSPGGLQSFCFGQDRYTYQINNRVTDDTTVGIRHDVNTDVGNCDPIASGGTELLDKNMRLLNFTVSSVGGGQFSINVRVAYGENDLLSTYDNSGVPNGQPPSSGECKSGIAGSNFCAVSELATVVDKRIE